MEKLLLFLSWHDGLQDAQNKSEDALFELFFRRTGYCLSQLELKELMANLDEVGLDFILDAVEKCCDYTLFYEGGSATPTPESVRLAFLKVLGHVKIEIRQKTDPYIKEIRYCIGILRNRFGSDRLDWRNQKKAEEWLRDALELGFSSQALRDTAIAAPSFANWTHRMHALVESGARALARHARTG